MSDPYEPDPDETPAWLPITVAVSAALVGLVGGAAIGWFVRGDATTKIEEVPVEVVRDYTPEELQIACLPLMRQTATTLEEAETQVEALSLQVRDKSAEVTALEDEIRRQSGSASRARAELARAKKELATLETALQSAEDDRARLEFELQETKEELSVTKTRLVSAKARTQRAEEDALSQRWTGFVVDAQLTICEKGTKIRIERCRDTVASLLKTFEGRFEGCVRSGDALPELVFDDKLETLPREAAWLDAEDKTTKGWHIVFCDPELPEANTRPRTGPRDLLGE